jgi:hypothetical protein
MGNSEAEGFRRKALEMIMLAGRTKTPGAEAVFRDLAAQYEILARQAELFERQKNGLTR